MKFPLICSIFHSVSNTAANGNNPVRISTESPGLAKNHKCISGPQNYSRNLMANHLHSLPGRSGSHCRKLRKKQQLHFGAKLSVRPVSFFVLIPFPQPCRKKSIFTHALLFTLSKKAGNLQAAHDRRKQMENFQASLLSRRDFTGRMKTIANPRSLVQATQHTDWPKLIQLSADTYRNNIGSPGKTNCG